MATCDPLDVDIRWWLYIDYESILATEKESFKHPWDQKQVSHVVRNNNCIGMVAIYRHRIVGHMVYGLPRDHLPIIRMAVAEKYRGVGVGRCMVDKLKEKLSLHRRRWLTVEMSEPTLASHLFFANQGFKVVSRGKTGYMMEYALEEDRYQITDPHILTLNQLPANLQWDYLLDLGWIS